MCGFAVIVTVGGRVVDDAGLGAVVECLKHRGPDGTGKWRDRCGAGEAGAKAGDGVGASVQVAMVHARMAILDLAGGGQPMAAGARGTDRGDVVAAVFNGCIYNHRALRRELAGLGHRFITDHSDTEVLLHGRREWGDDLVRRLEGMFAFAIWDRRAKALCIARDRAGEKPVYYWVDRADGPRVIAAGSTVPALLAAIRAATGRDVEAAKSAEWCVEYLRRGYCVPEAMPWKNVRMLPPGWVITWEVGAGTAGKAMRYWANAGERTRTASAALGVEEAERLVRSAVRARLEADVPLGCFMSGGVDSALVAAFAREEVGTLSAYTLRTPDARADESGRAAAIAKHLGLRHEILEVQPRPADDVERLIGELGLPFGDSSILPTHWVSRAARDHVKVALSGDGGDELFLGYERYVAARLLGKYRWMLGRAPAWPMRRFGPKRSLHRLARLGAAARGNGYRDLVDVFGNEWLGRLMAGVSEIEAEMPETVEEAAAYDFDSYLPDDLLRKVDTASMAVALEVRAPLLDSTLMQAALEAPVECLMPGGERKGLLKAVARRHLPGRLVDGPKRGFAVPIGQWFREDEGGMGTTLRDLLHSAEPFGGLPIDRGAAIGLYEEHAAGRMDHSHRLFTLLSMGLWAKAFGRG